MVLETIENRKPHTLAGKPVAVSLARHRVISESTGLVKFNITRKLFEEKEQANKDFASLEKKVQAEATTKTHHRQIPHKGSFLQLSPQRATTTQITAVSSPASVQITSRTKRKDVSFGHLDESLMLELASKQREVLEIKSNINMMKKKLRQTEKELEEIEAKCNRSQPPKNLGPQVPPRRHQGKSLDQLATLRSRPSIQTLKATIEYNSAQTNANIANLKKRISIPHLKSRASLMKLSDSANETLNQNFQKLQKDTNTIIERGLSFVTSLRNDMFREEEEVDYNDADSDYSDYGCADTSNYQLAVK